MHAFGHSLLSRCAAAQKRLTTAGLRISICTFFSFHSPKIIMYVEGYYFSIRPYLHMNIQSIRSERRKILLRLQEKEEER
jgi:hypothetical protein